jgi:DNA-binding transcriptional LysR family regulator
MALEQININLLYNFVVVYEAKNMTNAAEKLNITQSGVSQHIKHLEEILEVKLFDRVSKNIVPTRDAKELYKKWSPNFKNLEESLISLKSDTFELTGTLSVGCPIEFGNHFVLPRLANFLQENPKLKVKIFYGHTIQMQQMLKEGSLDLAFFDSFESDPAINLQPVYEETIELCASKQYLESKGLKSVRYKREYFEQLDYIGFLDEGPVLQQWIKHHFKGKKLNMNIVATLMDVQGIEALITNHMGAGILPQYRLNANPKIKKDLQIFRGPGGKLNNTISLAYLKNRRHDLAIDSCIIYLTKTFNH